MAKDLQKILSEGANISEEVCNQINEAWEAKLTEARNQITEELRAEYAKKFSHDKQVFVETVNAFLDDKISAELTNMADERRKVVEEKHTYKAKLAEHAAKLDDFITHTLAKEVKEVREEKEALKSNFKILENFLLKQLTEEIKSFREDKKALVEQKVRMISEGKEHLKHTKQEFIQRSAQLVESKLNAMLKREISQFREDIDATRKNEFGRRIFEAFACEFMTTHLNEGAVVKNVQAELQAVKEELVEAKATADKAKKLAEEWSHTVASVKQKAARDQKLSELLSPLDKTKRAVMADLLESVNTKDLESAFNKYVPVVLSEDHTQVKSRTLNESKVSSTNTGDKVTREGIDNQFNSELNKIKSLAGLK